MQDWAVGMERRNQGISRVLDRRHLFEMLGIISSIAIVAGVFFFYSWVRSQIVDVGYAEQQLRNQEEELLLNEKRLIAEEAMLKNPERIDTIARAALGMTRVRAEQLINPQYLDVESRGTTTLALAAVPGAANAKKEPAATN